MARNRKDADDVSDSLEVDNQIDLLCDSFENQWRSGVEPDLSSYLNRITPDNRSALFEELLVLDWGFRECRGESQLLREYRDKYPAYLEEIERIDLQRRLEETFVQSGNSTLGQSIQAGTLIDHFRLETRLGAGAVGEVWKATDILLERLVTIKFPRKAYLTENEANRFQREGKAAAQLQHPGIVSVHEVGQKGKLNYIVSDYVAGQDLRRWLGKNKPSPRETAEICAQIAEAVHHAHQKGVIHRDLKPANVIVDDTGSPHVTDFGLAKLITEDSEMTLEGDLLGTPAYMSPEQARGNAATLDFRTDIYSIGVILYELLTGSCPFLGDHSKVLNDVIHESPKEPSLVVKNVPRDLETICLKALEKRPQDRYPSAQELAVDLRRFLRGDSIIARRANVLERISRWIRKRPVGVSAVLLGVIAVAAIAISISYANQNRELQGLRSISLATEPVGAAVTLVPISKISGEYDLEGIIDGDTKTPLEMEVPAGLYLVVAVLDDGRFHEVLRRVPSADETYPGSYRHNRWSTDENGTVVLPKIDIPVLNVVEGMAFVEGSMQQSFVNERESKLIGTTRSFFIDPTEVTIEQYKQLTNEYPKDLRWQKVHDDWALCVNFDVAMSVAERLGKRLPTEAELIYAKEIVSSGVVGDMPGIDQEHALGPVGFPLDDQLNFTPVVYGLSSNVAEWTASWPTIRVGQESHLQVPFPGLNSHRVVCCGGLDAYRRSGLGFDRAPEGAVSVPIARVSSGLGFRCVRSARPRVAKEHFGNSMLAGRRVYPEVE